MSDLIPIKLAEAALDAALEVQAITLAKQYVSKATFDHTWLLYQAALEEGQQLKAELKHLRALSFITAVPAEDYESLKAKAISLAELTESKGFFYSKENQALSDAIIKQIKAL